MSEQIGIPTYAKCQKCGLEAKDQVTVLQSIGLRVIDGQIKLQSYCKKCRRATLPKELREKYQSFKDIAKKKYEKQGEKIKAEHDKQYDEIKAEYDKMKEKFSGLFTKLKEKTQKERTALDEAYKAELEAKKQELEKSLSESK